jgi:hypothetical protein
MFFTRSRSPPDPFLPVAFLQTGQSAKFRFCELANHKAAIGDLTQSAKTGPTVAINQRQQHE